MRHTARFIMIVAATIALTSCAPACQYLRGDRCVVPSDEYVVSLDGARLERYDTRPCVTVTRKEASQLPALLLYVLTIRQPGQGSGAGSVSSSQTRYTVRTDHRLLDIDTRTGRINLNDKVFRLKDGNVFIQSDTGACGPSAAQIGIVVTEKDALDDVLRACEATLAGSCGSASLALTR